VTNDQQRFEQLLPFYVNGTLTEQEREFVSAYLAKHNHARQSLTWTSSIQRTIQDLGSVAPDDQRVNRFLQKLAEQQQPKHTQQKNQSSVPSFLGLAGARENGSRRDWWLVIMGFGFAGLATLLVLMPGLFQNSVLHWDQLDGQPTYGSRLQKTSSHRIQWSSRACSDTTPWCLSKKRLTDGTNFWWI